jgi:hypothetical protein
MTIYKTQTGEKKNEKDPEVLTEPLVSNYLSLIFGRERRTEKNKDGR